MIVSGNSVESQQTITGVIEDPYVGNRFDEWADSYFITQQASAATLAVAKVLQVTPPMQGEGMSGRYNKGFDLFSNALESSIEALSGYRKITDIEERYLRLCILSGIVQENSALIPTEAGGGHNHLTRLALKGALNEMKYAPNDVVIDSAEAVSERFVDIASRTLTGLRLLNESLQTDEDVLVVHFMGNRVQSLAGNPKGNGISKPSHSDLGIHVVFPGRCTRVETTTNLQERSFGQLEMSHTIQPSVPGRIQIPVSDVAPVARLSVAEINEEGFYSSGDFETGQSPLPRTVIVTGLAEEILRPTDIMFERRNVVAAVGKVAQLHLAFYR